MARDDFSASVKRDLAARVSTTCSNPDCRAQTAGPDSQEGVVNVGVAAHITAAAPGGGRYDLSLTPEQRSSASNGVWLCQNCAHLIDNPASDYSVELLRSWKVIAEDRARRALGKALPPPSETPNMAKLRGIRPLVGSTITFSELANPGREQLVRGTFRSRQEATILDCTEFFVKISLPGAIRTIPLESVLLAYDDRFQRHEIQQRTA